MGAVDPGARDTGWPATCRRTTEAATGTTVHCRAHLDRNRRLLAALLATHLPAVGYVPPQASYLAWLDCTALGLGDDPAAYFLVHGRVALSRGLDFGTNGAGSCV